ncbi:MAG: HAMP domain-containing histidine kinase [Ignavibacteriales bacterium]|nr:HAMP domain-containing histidine kinase [Ignavibacteriales bacterium]
MSLVPEWAQRYDEFWKGIRERNLWFIKLRFIFILFLLLLITFGEYVFKLNFSPKQLYAFLIITGLIFCYNIFLIIIRRYATFSSLNFNVIHVSILQSVFDLSSLTLLIYYTGTIHSPLFIFYIFQIIIGSMILPGYVIYTIATITIIAYSTLIILQHNSTISSHFITGLYSILPPHPTDNYVLFFILAFSAMIIVGVILANNIARSLYLREQELRESLDKIESLETMKQKYIMGVVHEIKTPISAVQSIIELILYKYLGPVPDQISEKLERARLRTDESIQMINNILRISQVKLLNISSAEEIDLIEVLTRLIEQQTENARKRNITIKFNDFRKKNRLIKGDTVLFNLAFSNILNNSIKYNKQNGNVEVLLNDRNNYCEIQIIDTGIGIPRQDIDKVFNQFYRATNIRRSGAEGSGMGLSLVKEIIIRFQGEIAIESRTEQDNSETGTKVIISLPYDYQVKT